MVLDSSKTGLLPFPTKNYKATEKKGVLPKLEFQKCIQPVPLSVKPFAALCNPFRRGCSIFCNHPNSNTDLKMMIKKSKMRNERDQDEVGVDRKALADRVGEVLEEMMMNRLKTFPDTEESTSTSDNLDNTPQPRPHLVLNLMRTASQETLSTHMGGLGTGGNQSTNMSQADSPVSMSSRPIINKLTVGDKIDISNQEAENETATDGGVEEDGEVQKRRGKVKKNRKKTVASTLEDKSSKEVVGLVEPGETQVSAWKEGDELSWCGSSHPTPLPTLEPPVERRSSMMLSSDVFDNPTVRHLRRSLSFQQAEGEFRRIWRNVLFEALAASDKVPETEPIVATNDDIVEESDPKIWIEYPREFDYSSARFDIPVSKATLNGMKPLDYLKNYVVIAKDYRLLYNYVFMKFRQDPNKMPPWFILAKDILNALARVVGRQFTVTEAEELHYLVDWNEDDLIDLRTWHGIAALAERVFGLRFSTTADPDMGERQEIEKVDFEAFDDRRRYLKIDAHLDALLQAVKDVKRKR